MKKITKEAIQEFVKQAYDLYDNFYRNNNEHNDIGDAVNMLLEISDLWDDLVENLDCWYDGDRIICEAIGDTVKYWDTDVVDQLSFIDDLGELAFASCDNL